MHGKDLSTEYLKAVQELHWGVTCWVEQPLYDAMGDRQVFCGVLHGRVLARIIDGR